VTGSVVDTGSGRVRGFDQGDVVAFRGIPYAAPPRGPLRFRPPEPPAAWDGVRDCTAFGSPPPQLPPAPGVPPLWRPELGLDHLTLNVCTPDLGAAGLPVMVWIHGGLWKHGASSMPQYDARALAGRGVVVVTLDYRVGFEGFGHIPGVPDNRGLRDQVAALEWVRRDIAAFGGDPGNVTVFGQSAGAASAVLLASSPAARGLFRRVIAQSVPAGCRDEEEAAAVTAAVAAAAGVPATWDGLAGLPPEALLAVQDAPLTSPADGPTAFGPVLDGDLVTGPPGESIDARTDLICGFTHEEYLGQGPLPGADVELEAVAAALGLGPDTAAAYRAAHPGGTDAGLAVVLLSDALIRIPTLRVAETHARAGGRTWVYDFAWSSPTVGAAHGVDVPFTFGTSEGRFAARLLGSPAPAAFAPLSEAIRAAWTSFAATGDPGWPRYDLRHRRTRIWDVTPTDAEDPIAASRRIWQRMSS
jgi:carboxylesterase type B